jgi:hypothetical protein
MTPPEHYAEAERLLAEGGKVVTYIGVLNRSRIGSTEDQFRHLTERMDEYGKKAMGIWAQAQVHATLAITAYEHPAAGFR